MNQHVHVSACTRARGSRPEHKVNGLGASPWSRNPENRHSNTMRGDVGGRCVCMLLFRAMALALLVPRLSDGSGNKPRHRPVHASFTCDEFGCGSQACDVVCVCVNSPEEGSPSIIRVAEVLLFVRREVAAT